MLVCPPSWEPVPVGPRGHTCKSPFWEPAPFGPRGHNCKTPSGEPVLLGPRGPNGKAVARGCPWHRCWPTDDNLPVWLYEIRCTQLGK